VTMEIIAADVPSLPGAIDLIHKNYLTGADHTNRVLIEDSTEWGRDREKTLDHLLLDPQTSGGLLISVPPDRCDGLFDRIKEVYTDAAIVGHVADKGNVSLRVK
jgi:selenide,water dikinase